MAGEPSDSELLDAWAGGAPAAGEALVRRHYGAISRFFANKVSRDPEELVQRTFLRCVENRATYRGDAPFRAYLFGVARNVLLEHFREKRRQADIDVDGGVSSAHALDPSPSQMISQRREIALLLESLRRVPLDLQVLLELSYWEDLTTSDVAAILDIPQGTVKGRLSRARRLLALEYERLGKERGVTAAPLETQLLDLARPSNG